MDTVVFDIETSNFFTTPGVGWNNFEALKISVVGLYSYAEDKYHAFEEGEMDKVAEYFRKASRIVGFSMNRYDIPVLEIYFRRLFPGENLLNQERIDLLEEVEMAAGHRISLSKLAEANLGVSKDRMSHEAITLFKEGRMAELKEYCLKDVELTKELYDIYKTKDHYLLPDRETGANKKVFFVGRDDLLGKEGRLSQGKLVI